MNRGDEVSLQEERVLVLAPTGRDSPPECAILREVGFSIAACADVEALCRELPAGAGAALVAEESLVGRNMACMVEVLGQQPPWSDFPMVVLAKEQEVDRSLLQVLGNITLLDRPVRTATLVSAMRGALRSRRRQYLVRDLLHRLEEADRRKDEFLAMLGHELRNPLASIHNALQVLDQIGSQEAGPARQRAIIGRQVRHLSRLVDDLLDVSRITSGKIALDTQPVDLKELAERCLQAHVTAIEAQRKGISLSVKAEPVIVEGDPVRLEQVVLNLLSNAVKYTPSGGRVRVQVRTERGEAVLRVHDTGIGIAPDMLPRIFDLFAQVEGALDRSQGGLGLGLTLVRRLVELHGGSVAADSRGLGQGSEFVVRLPLRSGGQAFRCSGVQDGTVEPSTPEYVKTRTPERLNARTPERPSLRILVVEDNADARETLRDLLELDGHQVEIAVNGPEGVERILAHQPDVALVDIGLPGLDGYQVARQVRDAETRRRGDAETSVSPPPCVSASGTFLVALTGYGQPEDRQQALEAGFNAHLVKPLDLKDLFRLLSDLR